MHKFVGLSLVMFVLTACSTQETKKVEAGKTAQLSTSKTKQKKRVAGYVKSLPRSGKAVQSQSRNAGESDTARTFDKKPLIKLAQAELTSQSVQSANCKDIFEAMAYFYVATKMTKTSAPSESVAHEKRYQKLKSSYDKKCP